MKAVPDSKSLNFAMVLGLGLLLGACAGQPTVPQTAEEAVAALEANTVATTAGEGEELICRSEVVTGTNFRRRTCRTAAEWEARSQLQRRVVEDRANNERGQAGVDSATGATPNAAGF